MFLSGILTSRSILNMMFLSWGSNSRTFSQAAKNLPHPWNHSLGLAALRFPAPTDEVTTDLRLADSRRDYTSSLSLSLSLARKCSSFNITCGFAITSTEKDTILRRVHVRQKEIQRPQFYCRMPRRGTSIHPNGLDPSAGQKRGNPPGIFNLRSVLIYEVLI